VALTTPQRDQVWRAFMRFGGDGESFAFTKTELRAAVDSADDFATSVAAAYNLALPIAFRTAATSNEKAALFGLICWLRGGRPLPEGL
jgi:hypothetical protein